MLRWITLARSWHLLVRIGLVTIAVAATTALQLPIENYVPGEPFLLYFVAVIASAGVLGRTAGFVAVVETSIASVLYFEPIYSLKLTYAIHLLAIEIYAAMSALSVEAVCRVIGNAAAEKWKATLADAQRKDAEARLADREAELALTRSLADSEARFRAMFESAAVGIALVAPDGRWLRVNDALCGFLGYPVDELLTKTFRQVTYPDDLAADVAQAELMREGKIETYDLEKRYVRKDGALVWGRKTASCVRKSDGSIDYFVFVVQDISVRKAHQEHVQLLMREVNHRSKNMLSLVQAIARQTAARDHEDFIERFSERIQALAANQDILVRNEWRGVDVEDLVRGQLAHLADLVGSRIRMEGPKLRLNATAAQAIGLALHELSTNAGKYGALSVDAGRVDVSWWFDDDIFAINWIERGGPPVSTPERRGFGITVVDLMAKRTVDGEVHLDFIPSGVVWNLTCPAANALEGNALHKNLEPATRPNTAPASKPILHGSLGPTLH
jgi:PAS domain S-box-containing protein